MSVEQDHSAPPPSTSDALRIGLQYQRAGVLQDAKRMFRAVLQADPAQVVALNQLGLIACQQQRPDAAIPLFLRAIAVNANEAGFHNNLGNAYKDLGQFTEAVGCYVNALRLEPVFAEGYKNLATVLESLNLQQHAEFAARLAQRISERSQQKESTYDIQAVVPISDLVNFCVRLGDCLHQLGAYRAALTCFEAGLIWAPKSAPIVTRCSAMLCLLGREKEALPIARTAVELDPTLPEAHNNLGTALTIVGCFAEAIHHHRQAVELGKGSNILAQLLSGLGYVLGLNGQLTEAVQYCRASLSIDPGNANVHVMLSFWLLKSGDFDSGWKEYEWRLADPRLLSPSKDVPQWRGEPLAGRSILVRTDQGFGDSLQALRYVQLLTERGGTISMECPNPLLRLVAANTSATVIEQGSAIGAHDYHVPSMSLPLAFGTRIDSIPAPRCYIVADEVRSADFRFRVQQFSGLKVGLVWATGRRPSDIELTRTHRRKSMQFVNLEPLLALPKITFFCLQKDESRADAHAVIASGCLVDWTDELKDFADNAALVANLDLIISVDTSMAHLAAAMGKSTWVLLPRPAEWRWLENREDSPWYPTARLFRQSEPGKWDDVIQRVIAAILNLVGS